MNRIIKTTWAVLLSALLIVFSACGAASPLGEAPDSPRYQTVESGVAASSASFTGIEQRGGYNTLTSAGQALYEELLESFYFLSEQPKEDGTYTTRPVIMERGALSEREMRKVIMAVQNDNPQVFWLTPDYTLPYTLRGTRLYFSSYFSAEECKTFSEQLEAKAKGIASELPAGQSELDREETLFRALAQLCSYDNGVEKAPAGSHWESYTAYGALCKGLAVCEGYSRAMQLLCSYAGLECRLVNGWGSGERHMWNLVRVNGEWYHMDPTWNDGEQLLFDYFNLTDRQIAADHTLCGPIGSAEGGGSEYDFNLPLPACTATDANYFRAKGIPLRSFGSADNAVAAKLLAKKAAAGESSVVFYVEETLDYETAVQSLFLKPPYQFFLYAESANRLGASIDLEAVHYARAEPCRGITVLLKYTS